MPSVSAVNGGKMRDFSYIILLNLNLGIFHIISSRSLTPLFFLIAYFSNVDGVVDAFKGIS